MLRIVVLLSAIACALGAVIPEGGLLPMPDGRIVGGTYTEISKYPYQVSVQKNGAHSCGGSIYTPTIVVTAAHCLQNSIAASAVAVRAGSTTKNSDGQLIKATRYLNHAGYNAATKVNDIALVFLSSAITYNANAQPIALATKDPLNGAAAVVSGWGATAYKGSSPTQLMYTDVTIVLQQQCASSTYKYGSTIRETMICAYTPGKDACQGDSGGPLVSGGVLVGIVSWGEGCAYTSYPGVYSDVASLRSWVEANAK